MTEQPPQLPPGSPPKRPRLTATRVVVWLSVTAVAVYLIINGAIGILEKG